MTEKFSQEEVEQSSNNSMGEPGKQEILNVLTSAAASLFLTVDKKKKMPKSIITIDKSVKTPALVQRVRM